MNAEENPIFFSKPEDFRDWLKKNHERRKELWVGYYKIASGLPSVTWPESVNQALCFGWIDGIRKSIDEISYKIRFTPRKSRSHWSDVNIKYVKELKRLGLMEPAGLLAFKKRQEQRSGRASYEQAQVVLGNEFEKIFKANRKAWDYFISRSQGYQKQTIWWVMSAKREETRLKRLHILIESSEKEEVIPPLRWTKNH